MQTPSHFSCIQKMVKCKGTMHIIDGFEGTIDKIHLNSRRLTAQFHKTIKKIIIIQHNKRLISVKCDVQLSLSSTSLLFIESHISIIISEERPDMGTSVMK